MIETTGQFLRGAGDIWRGARLLAGRPRLWVWAAIPFVLNTALFALIVWLAWSWAGGWIGMLFEGGFWWDVVGWIVTVLFWALMLLIVVFLFVPVATLVALPFNDALSEQVEVLLTGASGAEPFSLRTLARSFRAGIGSSLRLAATMLLLLPPILLLNLVPVIGQLLSGLAAAALTIRYLSLEYTGYSMDRRYWDWRRRKQFLRRHRARTIGLGSMAWLLMMIPLVNALFIPVSAVAGTILFCESEARTGGSVGPEMPSAEGE